MFMAKLNNALQIQLFEDYIKKLKWKIFIKKLILLLFRCLVFKYYNNE